MRQHFPSLVGKNIGSIIWYEKTKRPITVEERQSETITPGAYIM